MPCRDYMDEYLPKKEVDDTNERKWMLRCFIAETGNPHGNFNLDTLSAALCAILRKKTPNEIKAYSTELQAWWTQHQIHDARHKK